MKEKLTVLFQILLNRGRRIIVLSVHIFLWSTAKKVLIRWRWFLKFAATEVVTILEGIELTIGRSGAIIPNARLKVSYFHDIFSLKNNQDLSAIEDLSNSFTFLYFYCDLFNWKFEGYREVWEFYTARALELCRDVWLTSETSTACSACGVGGSHHLSCFTS